MQKIIRIDLVDVNCYLIENEGKYILVDTGGHMFRDRTYCSREKQLKAILNEYGVTKDNLKLLILTHGDCDHIFNASAIHKEYEVPVAMCSEDIRMVFLPKWDCYKINSKYSSIVLRIVFKKMEKKIEPLMQKVYKDYKSFEPDIILQEGSDLSEYGFDGMIYHTPGHTQESICILDSEGNMICGDLFANMNKPSLPPNASDFKILKEQARRMLALPVKTIYPGHGEPFSANRVKL